MNKTIFALIGAITLASASVAYAGSDAIVTGPAQPIYSEQAAGSQGSNTAPEFALNGQKVQLGGGALAPMHGSNAPVLSEAEAALTHANG
ncbi:MAG TPA: hypothetical protein VMU82_02895 [Acetobacteraceae bacterium]|nr:hypothetical protein [Acetobacteraceae bacterium]